MINFTITVLFAKKMKKMIKLKKKMTTENKLINIFNIINYVILKIILLNNILKLLYRLK